MLESTVFGIRLKFSFKLSVAHLFVSSMVGVASAIFVFFILYPMPYRELLGVKDIFLIILSVDVVCGPLLTLVLANPQKSLRERSIDFGLVAIIQIFALVYGLHTVWVARPVVIAFEVDRLVVVTANEVNAAALTEASPAAFKLPWYGILKVGTRQPRDSQELFRSLEFAGAGVSPAMLPSWWTSWEAQYSQIKNRCKPVSELMAKRVEYREQISAAVSRSKKSEGEVCYLPMVSGVNMDWVALLDRDFEVVGGVAVDGF